MSPARPLTRAVFPGPGLPGERDEFAASDGHVDATQRENASEVDGQARNVEERRGCFNVTRIRVRLLPSRHVELIKQRHASPGNDPLSLGGLGSQLMDATSYTVAAAADMIRAAISAFIAVSLRSSAALRTS